MTSEKRHGTNHIYYRSTVCDPLRFAAFRKQGQQRSARRNADFAFRSLPSPPKQRQGKGLLCQDGETLRANVSPQGRKCKKGVRLHRRYGTGDTVVRDIKESRRCFTTPQYAERNPDRDERYFTRAPPYLHRGQIDAGMGQGSARGKLVKDEKPFTLPHLPES